MARRGPNGRDGMGKDQFEEDGAAALAGLLRARWRGLALREHHAPLAARSRASSQCKLPLHATRDEARGSRSMESVRCETRRWQIMSMSSALALDLAAHPRGPAAGSAMLEHGDALTTRRVWCFESEHNVRFRER